MEMEFKRAATFIVVFLLQNESVKMKHTIKPVVVPAGGECPTEQQRADTLQIMQNNVSNCISDIITFQAQCGVGDWERVAFFKHE